MKWLNGQLYKQIDGKFIISSPCKYFYGQTGSRRSPALYIVTEDNTLKELRTLQNVLTRNFKSTLPLEKDQANFKPTCLP